MAQYRLLISFFFSRSYSWLQNNNESIQGALFKLSQHRDLAYFDELSQYTSNKKKHAPSNSKVRFIKESKSSFENVVTELEIMLRIRVIRRNEDKKR